MPLMPAPSRSRHRGGPVGVLLCHGFTGNPAVDAGLGGGPG